MITVHHLENSRSLRVLWLLEELGVPYEVTLYKRQPTLQAPPDLKRVHPLGKSPVIVDDNRVIAETGAIVEYILETHGDGRFVPPPATPDYWLCKQFLHSAEGSLMPPLILKFVLSMIPARAGGLLKPFLAPALAKASRVVADPRVLAQLDHCEVSLAATGWFAGPEPTAADVMMSFPLEMAEGRFGLAAYPNCRAFLARVHARPAYMRATARGGPLRLGD